MRRKDFGNLKKLSMILLSGSMILGGCGQSASVGKKLTEEGVALAAKAPVFEKKELKYKIDETTEVLIDKTFKKEDIIKVVKHGDHWHVWTKDNVEHITYTNPEEMEDEAEIEAVNVVSADSLSEKEDEVVKILQHGDHYHVFTASGKEYISYENPRSQFPKAFFGKYEGKHGEKETNTIEEHENPAGSLRENESSREKIEKLNIITVFGEEKVNRYDIVKVLRHGDHYHIYDSKGKEGILYFDPKELFPSAEYGDYIGNHGDEKQKEDAGKSEPKAAAGREEKEETKQVNKEEKKPKNGEKNENKVIKILQHGDHYHIYTKDGEEFISYENPRNQYPDAEFGQYEGSHGEETEAKKVEENESEEKEEKKAGKKKEKTKGKKKVETKEEETSFKKEIKDLQIVNLLGQKLVNRYDIVKILQHGDHYHIYDSKGNEGILYTNPKDLYPNATFGQYEGSHGEAQEKEEKKDSKDIKTAEEKNKEAGTEADTSKEGGTKNEASSDGSRVVSILVHGDHYHVYTADGREFITYSDPRSLYPEASFGVYTGSHGDEKGKEKSHEGSPSGNSGSSGQSGETSSGSGSDLSASSSEMEREEAIRALEITGILGKAEVNRFDIVKILQHEDHFHIFDSNNNEGITRRNPKNLYPKAIFGQYEGSHGGNDGNKVPIVWPEGITRIIDHGDHWHLIKGDKEVVVVNEDPRERYPDAEYIEEKADDKNVKVEDSELFTYGEITPKMTEGIGASLDENLRAMTHFGTIPSNGIPSFGANGETTNVFYWLHYDHYHAITIKQIIANAKLGKYAKFTAREVVAALKAKIENREAFEEEVIDGSKNDAIKKYLTIGFDLDWNYVEIIGNKITVYLPGNKLLLHANDFEERDGFIRAKHSLAGFTDNDVKVVRYGSGSGSTNYNPNNGETERKKAENFEKLKAIFGEKSRYELTLLAQGIIKDVIIFAIEELEIDVANRILRLRGKDYAVSQDAGSSLDGSGRDDSAQAGGNTGAGSDPRDTGSGDGTGGTTDGNTGDSASGNSGNTGSRGMANFRKEEENFKKLAEIFNSSEDEAFDLIFEFMDKQGFDTFSVANLEIDVANRTITLNGTSYVVPADFRA